MMHRHTHLGVDKTGCTYEPTQDWCYVLLTDRLPGNFQNEVQTLALPTCNCNSLLNDRFLATGDSYRTLAFSYRVGFSVVGIVKEVCEAIWSCLVGEYMPFPGTGVEGHCRGLKEIVEFSKHVTIQAPANSGFQFQNYKGSFSIVLLAVVGARYRFRTIDVGAYGKSSDGGMLSLSAFCRALHHDALDLWAEGAMPLFLWQMRHFLCGGTWWGHSLGTTCHQSRESLITAWLEPGGWWSVPSASWLHNGDCTGESLECHLKSWWRQHAFCTTSSAGTLPMKRTPAAQPCALNHQLGCRISPRLAATTPPEKRWLWERSLPPISPPLLVKCPGNM